MKTLFLLLLLVNLGFASINGWSQTTFTPVDKSKLPATNTNTSAAAIFANLIDPAVTGITFTTVKLSTGDKLVIKGTVKNIGGKTFESGSNQQVIQLFEIRTPTNRVMLKQLPFSRLTPGQELKIEHTLPALKPGDEFPPDYQVLIVYDPDIFIDANKNNDDGNLKNNSLSKNPRN